MACESKGWKHRRRLAAPRWERGIDIDLRLLHFRKHDATHRRASVRTRPWQVLSESESLVFTACGVLHQHTETIRICLYTDTIFPPHAAIHRLFKYCTHFDCSHCFLVAVLRRNPPTCSFQRQPPRQLLPRHWQTGNCLGPQCCFFPIQEVSNRVSNSLLQTHLSSASTLSTSNNTDILTFANSDHSYSDTLSPTHTLST